MAELATAVDALRSEAGSRVRVGVSPHAPYTVSPPLYRAVADYAREQDLPVAMHLAESRAEVALVTAAKGAFADAWHRRDIPAPATARSAVGYVLPTGILDCRPLVIHAVQVDDDDVRVLADAGATVTVCPGSNRAHGHGDPPVRQIRAMGLPLGVGTDSVASVGSLDLFREARLAVEIGGLTADEGLALMTAGGAAAMGLDAEVGSVDIGKWADLCLIEVPDVAQSEVAAVLLGSEPGRILRTYGAGRCLYARSVPSPSSMPHTPSPE